MLLYKDVLSGDELLSDSYDITARSQGWRGAPFPSPSAPH
jgi:hypothetical protein